MAASPTRAEILLQESSLVIETQQNEENGREAIHATLIGKSAAADFTLTCVDKKDLVAIFWFPNNQSSTGRVDFSYEPSTGKRHHKRGYLSNFSDTESRLVVEIDPTRTIGIAPIIFLKNLFNSEFFIFSYAARGQNDVLIVEEFDLKRFNQFWFGRILEECGRKL